MFEEIKIKDLSFNVFDKIGKEWMLITAGTVEKHNAMTASWGNLGVLWHKPVATVYVRPQRFTKTFLDKEDFFTISFYDESKKDALLFYGQNSGKDIDKDSKTNFVAKSFDRSVAFEEADLVFVCKKTFCDQMNPNKILNKTIIKDIYENNDFHYIYIGEIVAVFKKVK